MTDATAQDLQATPPRKVKTSLLTEDANTKRRNASEARFKIYGFAAVMFGVLALVVLMTSILTAGLSAFKQAKIAFPMTITQEEVDTAERALLKTGVYRGMIERNLLAAVEAAGIDPATLAADPLELISRDAPGQLRAFVLENPDFVGTTRTFTFLAGGRIDGYYKGRVTMESAALDNNTSPEQLMLADQLLEAGVLTNNFNRDFLTNPDAGPQRPEAAGLGVALIGSLYMMLIVLALALPIGVAASIYLEEFAPKNWITDLIEVNISNLAAVPSIVFGILGLAIFINFAGLPQSAPVVGGLVLTLMTLPTIIIATRASLKSVPPSIRDAALGVGASKMQSVFHHVLPLAAPGILTGTIIGLAQALGETAPLLLIGMVAFVREYPAGPPEGFFDPASALPVQIYNWTQRSDPAFVERASGAIIVLLVFLLAMNALAIFLRRRFERRW